MEKINNYEEERFDSFLNKTIIMSSRKYFLKQMNIVNKENTIVDNEDYASFLQNFIEDNNSNDSLSKIELSLELNKALYCLSDIEQAVIFLLFDKELTQAEAAEFLEIYSKTVSKIKIRAIEKLRRYMEGEQKNEE